MALAFQGAQPELVDYGNAPDIYCSGMASVELIDGGVGCFTLYRNLGAAGRERQLVCKVFAPVSAIPGAVELMLASIGQIAVIRAVNAAKRLMS